MYCRIFKNLLFLAFLFTSDLIFAQVGINNTTPDASAELDIKSTTRGFLAPRMTGTQMNAIVSPATGLTVFNTDSSAYCVYTGSAWIKILTNSDNFWSKAGNDIYTNNSGNVGIGIAAPLSKLHIHDNNFLVTGFTGYGNTIEAAGAGVRMFFNPYRSAFRAGEVSGSHWDAANIGIASFAVGDNNTANGSYSFSGGFSNTASGQAAVALGLGNTASGVQSFALGRLNTAASYGEIVVGVHATTYTANSATNFNTADRLFNIGNGTSSVSRSDAFTVLKSGNTGVGIATPLSKLQVANGNFLVTGTTFSGNAIEATGAGTRMFFNPKRAAFRAGDASSSEWDDSNIGYYSFATGQSTKASGDWSFSAGVLNTASSLYSTAFGGGNIASGSASLVAGTGNTASSWGETVLGTYATTYTVGNATNYLATDRLFNIGNGINGARSDAFTVLKSGNTGIGNATPNSILEVNGALAVKVKTAQVAGTNNPDNTGEIWFYSSGTGTITLPDASTCTNRMYTIVNQTSATRNISTYKDMTGSNNSLLANNTSICIISDGTNWRQFK